MEEELDEFYCIDMLLREEGLLHQSGTSLPSFLYSTQYKYDWGTSFCNFTYLPLSTIILFRALGVVSGMTGAGGNVGAVITQAIFFRGSEFKTQDGITYMGIMIIGCSLAIMTMYFPQWGGMFFGPKPDFSEEDYYLQEWESKEQGKRATCRKLEICRRQQERERPTCKACSKR